MSLKEVPLSAGLPILGNVFAYKKDRLKMLQDHHKKYGDIFRIKVGPKKLLVITDPEYIGHVMMKNMKNYEKRTNFELLMGRSVFIESGAKWKAQRSLLQPLLAFKYVKSCMPEVSRITQKNLSEFIQNDNKGDDIRPLFSKITFEVILKTVIGLDYTDAFKTLESALFVVNDYLANDSYRLIPLPKSWDKRRLQFEEALKNIDEVVYGAIERAKKDPNGNSLVHILLKAVKEDQEKAIKFDDKLLRDNIVAMTFAGYETSALTMSWFSYCLSQDAQWQEKCRQEAKAFNLETMSYEDLAHMPHIEAALLETMRLYPAGWAFTRNAINDDQVGDYKIEKDEPVLISTFLTHRDPKLWEKADEFIPSRFLGKGVFDYGKFQYFPFGAGPRICMGMQLGLMEMKVMALYMLKNYSVVLSGEHPILDARATLFSQNLYQLKLR